MKVEKVKKMGDGKYKLIFDNADKMITYDDVILKNNLLYGDIDADTMNQIHLDNAYYGLYHKLLKMISTRLRSEKEIRAYLEKEQVSPLESDRMVFALKRNGLLDDKVFMKAYISDKLHLTNDGPYKIKGQLMQHDIKEELIDEELAKIDPDFLYGKMEKLVLKKIANNKKYSNSYLRQKVCNELGLLGYDKDKVGHVFENLQTGTSNIIEREYDKVYKQLSKKYTGKELDYKIKQRLYQYGFNAYEIDGVAAQKKGIV